MAQTKRTPVPAFSLGNGEHNELEVPLAAASPARAKAAADVVQGIDLSDRPKIVLLAGRGKTGKTTSARWMADRALANDRTLLMGDLDPTNATFSTWFSDVSRPPDVDHAEGSVRWLEKFVGFALQHRMTALVDLGGGDATLRRLVDDMPDLAQTVSSEGAALVMLYFAGPQVDDLAPVVAMEERGFQPPATALVLNEAAMEPGMSREEGFARLRRHSAFKAALARGAIPVWMPRLLIADQVEARRVHFTEARDGAVRNGAATFGPFDRSRVRIWLDTMEAQFGGVATWLP